MRVVWRHCKRLLFLAYKKEVQRYDLVLECNFCLKMLRKQHGIV